MAVGKPTISLVEASFTRPSNTTAYTAADLMANSTTAASVTPMEFVVPVGLGRGLRIVGVKCKKSGTTATNSDFKINLFTSSPTVANGDNGAFSSTESGYIGQLDIGTLRAFTDDCSLNNSLSDSLDITWKLNTGNTIYGLMEADAAYTPESAEVFTVTLVIEHF